MVKGQIFYSYIMEFQPGIDQKFKKGLPPVSQKYEQVFQNFDLVFQIVTQFRKTVTWIPEIYDKLYDGEK